MEPINGKYVSNYNFMKEMIKSIAGQENIIGIPRVYVSFMGSLEGGAFLSQLIFWSDKGDDPDGWIYKKYSEWKDMICLSEYQVRKQTKMLKRKGFVETKVKKVYGNPTLHYKFNIDAFAETFLEFLRNETKKSNEGKQKKKATEAKNLRNFHYSTEITSKITPKTTTESEPLTLAHCIAMMVKLEKIPEAELMKLTLPRSRQFGDIGTVKRALEEIENYEFPVHLNLTINDTLRLINRFGADKFFDAMNDLERNMAKTPDDPKWRTNHSKVLTSYILQAQKVNG